MAGKKISQLDQLDQADDNDVFPIVDSSINKTKKIDKAGITGVLTPIEATSDLTITNDYFGKTIRVDTTSNITLTYDNLSEDDDGARVTFINKDEGKLTIQANGTDTIQDSGSGGTIYNNGGEYATLTLEYVYDLSKLVIVHGIGTWTTTI